MEFLIVLFVVGIPAAVLLLAVLFAPEPRERHHTLVGGQPLEIEAPSCRRVEVQPRWDTVDTHWGEAQWMLTNGS